MVAMTAPWTVPASGAQFPFGPCFALLALSSVSLALATRRYAHPVIRMHTYTRARRRVRGPCTCTGMYTRLQSVPRSGGRASSGCPLQWAKPTGQPQPAPTSRSDDHWDCALSHRDRPRFPRLSLFPFDLGVAIARLRQTSCASGKRRSESISGVAALSKSSDRPFTSLTGVAVQPRIELSSFPLTINGE